MQTLIPIYIIKWNIVIWNATYLGNVHNLQMEKTHKPLPYLLQTYSC